jgi:hypothetical protein
VPTIISLSWAFTVVHFHCDEGINAVTVDSGGVMRGRATFLLRPSVNIRQASGGCEAATLPNHSKTQNFPFDPVSRSHIANTWIQRSQSATTPSCDYPTHYFHCLILSNLPWMSCRCLGRFCQLLCNGRSLQGRCNQRVSHRRKT